MIEKADTYRVPDYEWDTGLRDLDWRMTTRSGDTASRVVGEPSRDWGYCSIHVRTRLGR